MGQVLAWVGIKYPDSDFNSNTVRAQLYRSCVNVSFAQGYKAPKFLFYDRNARTYSKYDTGLDTSQPAVDEALDLDEPEDGEFEPGKTFALESHLRDYLAKNLQILEKGLQLWSLSPPSVEHVIGNRRLDILAKDVEGVPVVVELKRDMGYDKVLGQALLYQGLVAAKLNLDRVRIMLVASEASEDLKIASARQKDLTIFEYSISFQAHKISSLLSEGS